MGMAKVDSSSTLVPIGVLARQVCVQQEERLCNEFFKKFEPKLLEAAEQGFFRTVISLDNPLYLWHTFRPNQLAFSNFIKTLGLTAQYKEEKLFLSWDITGPEVADFDQGVTVDRLPSFKAEKPFIEAKRQDEDVTSTKPSYLSSFEGSSRPIEQGKKVSSFSMPGGAGDTLSFEGGAAANIPAGLKSPSSPETVPQKPRSGSGSWSRGSSGKISSAQLLAEMRADPMSRNERAKKRKSLQLAQHFEMKAAESAKPQPSSRPIELAPRVEPEAAPQHILKSPAGMTRAAAPQTSESPGRPRVALSAGSAGLSAAPGIDVGATARKTYSYKDLKTGQIFPTDVDASKREEYLDDEEFKQIFGEPREKFAARPAWNQIALKKKHGLF